MSYKGVGTMYAAAGLGLGPTGISPPFRRYGFHSFQGLGAVSDQVGVPVRDLQEKLVRAGFSVGSTGIDGVWGSNTQGALNRALAATGLTGSDWAYSHSGGVVTLVVKAWNAIKALPAAPAPLPRPLVPSEVEVSTELLSRSEATDLTPWLIGGGALLALGGFFVWKGRKRRVAANRRRRRRRVRR